MTYPTTLLPQLIEAVANAIDENAEAVAALDQAIGDGDHVINLQRGLAALLAQREELGLLTWSAAWQKMGMTLMSTVGGASGSLLGTLLLTMAKAAADQALDLKGFAVVFAQGVEAMKRRGKSEAGEKTMLDVLVPVAVYLQSDACTAAEGLTGVQAVAIAGVESTRAMLATKGRAAFLAERSVGHIDAGAKSCQLMICAISAVLSAAPT